MLPLALGIELAVGVLDVFVPLVSIFPMLLSYSVLMSSLSQTGRMPPFVPAEHIIATPVAVFVFLSIPLSIPLASRLQASSVGGSGLNAHFAVGWLLRIATVAAVLWYAFISGWGAWPFDPEHPKRIFLSFTEDVSPRDQTVHGDSDRFFSRS